MLDPSFNRGIRGIIHLLQFPMYIVIRNMKYSCPCVDRSDTADPNCPLCLGTGYKIKIRKILGALQPDTDSFRITEKKSVVMNQYFFDSENVTNEMMQHDNIIVRDNEVDILDQPKEFRSDSNDVIYYYANAQGKKVYKEEFLRNFWKLVKGK